MDGHNNWVSLIAGAPAWSLQATLIQSYTHMCCMSHNEGLCEIQTSSLSGEHINKVSSHFSCHGDESVSVTVDFNLQTTNVYVTEGLPSVTQN